jgi:hypothetical protein
VLFNELLLIKKRFETRGPSVSPFGVCDRGLRRMISVVVSGGLLEGFKVGNADFSHLLFVDNSLIFCSAHSS